MSALCQLSDNQTANFCITPIMVGDAALINLVRRTLRRLEEQMGPEDSALRELKGSVLRSVAELTLVRMPTSPNFPDSKIA